MSEESEAPEAAETPAEAPAFDAVGMAKRRWALAKSPDLRERAVAALQRIGRAGLRELRRLEAAGKVIPPNLLSSASRPWEALLQHGEKLDEVKFAREELTEAKKLLERVRRERRLA